MPSCITLICGLPGSGKTSLINYLKRHLHEFEKCDDLLLKLKYEFHVIEYDQLIPLKQQERLVYQSHAWKEKRKEILRASEVYLCNLTKMVTPDSLVLEPTEELYLANLKEWNISSINQAPNICFIIEDNFYYSSMRYEWFQLARKYGLGFCEIFLDCTTEDAVQRNFERRERVPRVVIERVAERIEMPDHRKNKWERNSLIITTNSDNYKCHMKEVFNLMTEALENPVPLIEDNSIEKEQSQLACSQSLMHQLDLIFRKLISQKMKNTAYSSYQEPQALFKRLNEIKQCVMKKLKNGDITLPDELLTDLQASKTSGYLNQDLLKLIDREYDIFNTFYNNTVDLP